MDKKWRFSLTIAFLCLGILLSFQFKTQQALLKDLSLQSQENLLALMKNLTDHTYALNREVWDLKAQKKLLEKSLQDNNLGQTMQRELDKMLIANGTAEVQGPGIIVAISQPSGSNYLFHTDLMEIINDAWNAGAEAVSVNDQRVTLYTSVSTSEKSPWIAVNSVPITFPIVIKAIGKPETLQSGMNIPAGVVNKLNVQYDIPIEIKISENLQLPAVKKLPSLHFAEKN